MALIDLQSKKILMDFKHAKEELELKKEMISEMDSLFNNAINEYLKTNSELKDKWDEHLQIKDDEIEQIISVQVYNKTNNLETDTQEPVECDDDRLDENEELKLETENDPFNSIYKMVYREIVKKTHPDKLGTNLSESEKEDRISIYKNATIAYNKKDIGELLLCAFLAKVSFKVDDQEILMIKTTMKKCHDESSFLEQTYSWKWFYGDESMKNTLVEKFIYHHMSL